MIDFKIFRSFMVGKIKFLSQTKLKSAMYEANIRNGNSSGNLRHDLEKLNNDEVVTIFTAAHNFVADDDIDQHTSEEKLASILQKVTFTIQWEDENGKHVEEIILDSITVGR